MTVKNLVGQATEDVIKKLLDGVGYREIFLVEFGSDMKVSKVKKIEEVIQDCELIYKEVL